MNDLDGIATPADAQGFGIQMGMSYVFPFCDNKVGKQQTYSRTVGEPTSKLSIPKYCSAANK